jgi:hypothetical protein
MTSWLRHRAVAPLVAGVVAFTAGALQTLVFGVPPPAVHDEFSYILAADTFRHGRCANPPHPLWQHFETMHVLQQPVYASKYPPGQGLFLAAGWLAGGYPIVGVWLGMGLACAAIAWLLQACLPFPWPLVGGLLAATQLGFGEWADTYWGGGVATCGGALLVGGWFRMLRRPRPWPAVLAAVGIALLAVSRPFEGLLLCVPIGLATIVHAFRKRPEPRAIVAKCLLPAAAVLIVAACAFGYNNARVTGSPFRLPYLEHTRQYGVAPFLWIAAPRPEPAYRHETLREFYVNWELATYDRERTRDGWSVLVKAKLQLWWTTYLSYGLTPPLLMLPFVLLISPRTSFALAACIFVLGIVATLETWGFPHYVAPAAGLLYLIVVQCLRAGSLIQLRGRPVGEWAVAAWVIVCLAVPVRHLLPQYHLERRPWADVRADAVRRMQADGKRHLVIVRYGSRHLGHQEWVFNDADIDSAPVIWAREMGPDGRARLFDYFRDRVVWIMDEDGDGPTWTRLREPVKTDAALEARPD